MKNVFFLFAVVVLLSNFAVSQVTSAEVEWTEFVSPEGITVSFPGKPKTEKFETPVAGSERRVRFFDSFSLVLN